MYVCQGEYIFKNNTVLEYFNLDTAYLTHFFPASAAPDFQQCLRKKNPESGD